ncbi:6137_t:CDS:1 [Dentiscutata erythropus]|uniref:6137_t:CDS:1 n=1 Tax=Dentiscutata erythropus TaxID=1348616 RepID=A0A9N9EB74_9GLOM|nr:6137_t:CDS:1 [Dentiscutata erythropus]
MLKLFDQSRRSDLFGYIKFLPTIIPIFFNSVNALTENQVVGSSDSIIESIFDLMTTVLISSVITIDASAIKDYKKLKYLRNMFYISGNSIRALVLPLLQIMFCVKVYTNTQNFLFIIYLIVTLIINFFQIFLSILFQIYLYFINNNNSSRFIFHKLSAIIPPLLSGLFRFIADITFVFLAVKEGYVAPAYSFLLVPIIVAFVVAFLMFLDIFYDLHKDLQKKNELYLFYIYEEKFDELDQIDKILRPLRRSNRPMAIIGFCSGVVFCTIVGPSILWVKTYLILAFTSFILTDTSYKLYKRKKEIQDNVTKWKTNDKEDGFGIEDNRDGKEIK